MNDVLAFVGAGADTGAGADAGAASSNAVPVLVAASYYRRLLPSPHIRQLHLMAFHGFCHATPRPA